MDASVTLAESLLRAVSVTVYLCCDRPQFAQVATLSQQALSLSSRSFGVSQLSAHSRLGRIADRGRVLFFEREEVVHTHELRSLKHKHTNTCTYICMITFPTQNARRAVN